MASVFKFRNHVFSIFAPLVDKCLHICRKFGIETYHLLRARMHKAESLGMQSLTRKYAETVLYELTVSGIYGTLSDLRTVITFIIEQRVSECTLI